MFNFIAGLIHKTGVLGVFLLMLLENLVPVIPSELIMPMAGFEAARGTLNPVLTVLAGTVGSIVGGVVWYQVGRALGLERVKTWADHGGRWLTFSAADVSRADAWFKRWGAAAVCLGRCLPGVRGVICIPAGVARMPLRQFLLWSSLGALIWTTLLTVTGYVLKDHFVEVQTWLNPVSDGFLVLCVVIYVVRLLKYRKAA